MNAKLVVSLLALGATSLVAGSAEGFLQVGPIRKEVHFAKAAYVKDRFEPSKQVLHLVLSDVPVPSKALFDGLPMIQQMQRKNVKIRKAVDTDTESALWLSGIVDGRPQKGEVEMHLVDGHWLVTLEVWNE